MADGADAIYGTMETRYFKGQEFVGQRTAHAAPTPISSPPTCNSNLPNSTSMLFRRAASRESAGWDEGIHHCSDHDLYLRLLTGRPPVCRRAGLGHLLPNLEPVAVGSYRPSPAHHYATFRHVADGPRSRSPRAPDTGIRDAFFNAALGACGRCIRSTRRERPPSTTGCAWAPQLGRLLTEFPKGFRISLSFAGIAWGRISREDDPLAPAETGHRFHHTDKSGPLNRLSPRPRRSLREVCAIEPHALHGNRKLDYVGSSVESGPRCAHQLHGARAAPRQCPSDQGRPFPAQRGIPGRAAVRILSRLAASRWYTLTSLAAEWRTWRAWRSGRWRLIHFMWGERDLGFLDLVARRTGIPLA